MGKLFGQHAGCDMQLDLAACLYLALSPAEAL